MEDACRPPLAEALHDRTEQRFHILRHLRLSVSRGQMRRVAAVIALVV